MRLDKLSVLGLLKRVPLVGRLFKKAYYKELLKTIETIDARFNSPLVRFTDNIHSLYDVLNGAAMALEEDFLWFEGQSIVTHTKTSEEASRLLNGILEGRLVNRKDFLRDQEISQLVRFMSWYSNRASVEEFLIDAIELLGIYREVYPKDEEHGNVYETNTGRKWNPSLISFIHSVHFKLMVRDLIAISQLILRSQLRQPYG